MTNTGKVVTGLGLIGVIGLIAYALTKKQASKEGQGEGLSIQIIGPDGKPVETHSPANLTEGTNYIVRITVTNMSTKAGTPWPATLNLLVSASTDEHTLIPYNKQAQTFDASQTKSFDFPFTAILGSGGETGSVSASILSPDGTSLTSAVLPFIISSVAIIYGATISVEV